MNEDIQAAVKQLVDQLAVKGVDVDATMQDAIDRLQAATCPPQENPAPDA